MPVNFCNTSARQVRRTYSDGSARDLMYGVLGAGLEALPKGLRAMRSWASWMRLRTYWRRWLTRYPLSRHHRSSCPAASLIIMQVKFLCSQPHIALDCDHMRSVYSRWWLLIYFQILSLILQIETFPVLFEGECMTLEVRWWGFIFSGVTQWLGQPAADGVQDMHPASLNGPAPLPPPPHPTSYMEVRSRDSQRHDLS